MTVLYLPPVAITMVTVTSNNTDPVVGDDITLSCTTKLDSAVDTDVTLTAVWSGPEGGLTGSDPTMVSAGTYESILTLTSVETSNSGDYTCTAMASSDDVFVTDSEPVSVSLTITVGKAIR